MSLFAKHDFDVQYLPGPRNETTDYLSRSSTTTALVLSIGLEDDLKSAFEHLNTRMVTAE